MKRLGWLAFAALLLMGGGAWAAPVTVCNLPGSATQSDCLIVNPDGSVTVAGTLTPSGTFDINVKQVNGGTVSTGSGIMNAQTQRVAIATDSPGIIATSTVVPGTAPAQAVMSGCIYNSSAPAPTNGQSLAIQCDSAGRQIVAPLSIAAATTGGCTPYQFISTASTNAQAIKTSAGTLCALSAVNTTATIAYLRMYDIASGAATCSSATGSVHSYPIPPYGAAGGAGGLVIGEGTFGESYLLGVGYCMTGGGSTTDNTNGPAGVYINASYK